MVVSSLKNSRGYCVLCEGYKEATDGDFLVSQRWWCRRVPRPANVTNVCICALCSRVRWTFEGEGRGQSYILFGARPPINRSKGRRMRDVSPMEGSWPAKCVECSHQSPDVKQMWNPWQAVSISVARGVIRSPPGLLNGGDGPLTGKDCLQRRLGGVGNRANPIKSGTADEARPKGLLEQQDSGSGLGAETVAAVAQTVRASRDGTS